MRGDAGRWIEKHSWVQLFSHESRLAVGFSPACPPGGGYSLRERLRIVQKAHEMDHRYLRTRPAKTGRDLQDAARIRAHHDVGTRLEDPLHLLSLQLHRDVWVCQVVDAGASAAAIGVADVDDGHVGDRTQQRTRLRADLLAVR